MKLIYLYSYLYSYLYLYLYLVLLKMDVLGVLRALVWAPNFVLWMVLLLPIRAVGRVLSKEARCNASQLNVTTQAVQLLLHSDFNVATTLLAIVVAKIFDVDGVEDVFQKMMPMHVEISKFIFL